VTQRRRRNYLRSVPLRETFPQKCKSVGSDQPCPFRFRLVKNLRQWSAAEAMWRLRVAGWAAAVSRRGAGKWPEFVWSAGIDLRELGQVVCVDCRGGRGTRGGEALGHGWTQICTDRAEQLAIICARRVIRPSSGFSSDPCFIRARPWLPKFPRDRAEGCGQRAADERRFARMQERRESDASSRMWNESRRSER